MALGAAAFLAGLDKFFNLLADWPGYLSPLAAQLLPMSAASFMHVIGIVEMAVGAVILAGYTRLGGYVAADLARRHRPQPGHHRPLFRRRRTRRRMAIAAFTLARLTEAGVGAEVRDAAGQTEHAGRRTGPDESRRLP